MNNNNRGRNSRFLSPLESGGGYVASIFILIICLLVWSANAEISRIVRVEGKIIPAGKSQKIQHLEGGILSEIYVQEGDFVRKGAKLLSIDNTQAGANLGETQIKLVAQRAQASRLKAEAEGLDAPVFDKDIIGTDAEQAEIDLFHARQKKLDNEIAVQDSMLNQRLAELDELKQSKARLQAELNTAIERHQIIKNMSANGSASKLELIEAKSREQNLRTEIGNIGSSLPKIEAMIDEAKGRIKERRTAFQTEAQSEYVALISEIERLNQVATAANDRLKRTDITAPSDGIINTVFVNTRGGVIKPGEILIELTPALEKILIEARASPSDRGFIHPGLPAQVRLSSYDVSEYGFLEGKITKVGADTLSDSRGQSFYQVNIIVEAVSPFFKGKEIVPGMIITADVVTGKRTILGYILSPLSKFTYNIFKDPR